jgi:hypothetical protein
MNATRRGKPSHNKAASDALCWSYLPLPSQAKFLASRARFKGFSGPVGSGKSAALSCEAIRLSFMNPGRKGVLAAPTLPMLRDATLAALFRSLEEQDIQFELRKSDGEMKLGSSQSTILLRSLEEPERLRGTNLAWFGVDELSFTREQGWLRLEARLRDSKATRLSGFGVWTPQGHDWLYRRFLHAPVKGYDCVRAKPFENQHLLERTPDYYERLESSYDPKFYRQEALGEYLNSRADRVYHCFDPSIHVTPQSYDRSKPLIWTLDFNVSPMSSVLLQRTSTGLSVIDEIVLERATTEEACMEFDNRYRAHAATIEIFGDASGRNLHSTGLNDYAAVQNYLTRAGFRNFRLRVPASNPPVLNRVRQVNALLTNALGEVRLEVDPRCRELIRDLEEVMFKPDSGVIDKLRDPKRTHASDALGYAIWELFGEKLRAGEQDKRLI